MPARGDLKIRGYTVGQFPNTPVWVALAGLLVALVVTDGSTVSDIARAVFYLAFTVWAYEELANGVNGFRRVLGAVGLLLVVALVATAIG